MNAFRVSFPVPVSWHRLWVVAVVILLVACNELGQPAVALS